MKEKQKNKLRKNKRIRIITNENLIKLIYENQNKAKILLRLHTTSLGV